MQPEFRTLPNLSHCDKAGVQISFRDRGTKTQKNTKKTMNTVIEYDPKKYSPRANALVLVSAQKWGCSPAEAAARLLDRAAKKKATKAPA